MHHVPRSKIPPPPMSEVKPAKHEEGELLNQMASLTAALHAQTEALHALAESNRQVVDLLLSREGDADEDAPANTYLDGTPMD